jgi:nucleoside-diphosphate-sugar epimerase
LYYHLGMILVAGGTGVLGGAIVRLLHGFFLVISTRRAPRFSAMVSGPARVVRGH